MDEKLKAARTALYREAILVAAEPIFAEFGFGGARLPQIAHSADLSVGTIYGVFGSKAELFSATLARHLSEITAQAVSAAATGTTPLDRLDRGVAAYIDFLLAHPNFLRVHLNEHPWGLGPTRGTADQIGGWRLGLSLLAKALAVAQAEGEVIPGNPFLMARALVATQQVHLAHWVEDGLTTPPETVATQLRAAFRAMFCIERRL